MGKLIAVVGNVGVGKTTFTQRLCEAAGFMAALEHHADRAFHAELAAGGHHSALANQIDFLLMRAEQEQTIRSATTTGVQDGGLDQDFWAFTHLFARTGSLQPPEFDVCKRLYTFVRESLPPPDLYIHLIAPLHVLEARYARRNRTAEVVRVGDLAALETLLISWIAQIDDAPVIAVDVTADDPTFAAPLAVLLPRIDRALK